MSMYRKKPVVIEARQLTDATMWDVYRWIGKAAKEWCWDAITDKFPERYIVIRTLEGDHRAQEGDYVIRGVKGEFYSCKPDIFELTYDIVEAAQ